MWFFFLNEANEPDRPHCEPHEQRAPEEVRQASEEVQRDESARLGPRCTSEYSYFVLLAS